MEKTLDEFLALPDVETERLEIEHERLGTFVIKPMTQRQMMAYRNRCKGKGDDIDASKYNLLVLSNHILKPDYFNNADFLTKAGCHTATEFFEKKFKAGEIVNLVAEITKLSGFGDNDFNQKVEEAKN